MSDSKTREPAPTSPLKQQFRPAVLQSKFADYVARLLDTKEPTPAGFYAEFICLPSEIAVLNAALAAASAEDLLAQLQPRIQALWAAALHELRKGKSEELSLNAAEILLSILRQVLRKPFPNPSIDILRLLAGSLDKSDAVFSTFVAAIDETLSNPDCQPVLRERILQVALVFAASIGQGSPNAYLLRRDLFRSLARIIREESDSHSATLSVALVGLLSNFRKFEARNAMLMRMEDLVDDAAMLGFLRQSGTALLKARSAFVDVVDDQRPTFVASLTTLLSVLNLRDVLRMSVRKQHTEPNGKAEPTPEEAALRQLPTAHASLLLPVYTLANANKAATALVLSDLANNEDGQPFLAVLCSFASYLFCHSAASARARTYSRLCLFVLQIFVEEGAGLASNDAAAAVRLCRQRQPMLPYSNDQKRPLICSILDCLVVFIRHNLRKKLDVDTYISALTLLHKSMHSLKTSRIRIAYDWTPVWRSLLSLAAFISSRREELGSAANIGQLQDLILIVLDFASLWGDVAFFSDADGGVVLLYEILRSSSALRDLCDQASPTAKTSARNLITVIDSLAEALSMPLSTPTQNGVTHTEINGTASKPATPPVAVVHDADVVLKAIRAHADKLDLTESAALEDVRPFSEAAHRIFFNELLRVCANDALQLVDKP